MRIYLKIFFWVLLSQVWNKVEGQQVAVKTNVPYWFTGSANVGAEFGLSRRMTLDLSGAWNPFTFSENKKWKHWLTRAELRYWTCERFQGHFFGLHAGGGEFNVGGIRVPFAGWGKKYRREGWTVAAGLSYGYAWVLGRRLNLEATVGAGLVHVDYKKYACPRCGSFIGKERETFVSITRLGINLVYFLK